MRRIVSKVIGLMVVTFCLLFSSFVLADIEQIKSLLAEEKGKQAYEIAESMKLENEGDPVFDYYYGLSAIEAGFINKALMAFERVIMFYPKQHRARIELARCYFILGNYELSRNEFEKVLQLSPPESVVNKINLFLKEITKKEKERKRVITSYVDISMGYDDNINGATSYEQVYVPHFAYFQLSEDSRKMSSTFTEIKAGFQINKMVSKIGSWFANVDFSNKTNFVTSDFDTNLLSIGGGYSYLGKNNKLLFPVSFQSLLMDGEESRYSVSASAMWMTVVDQSTDFTGFFQIASTNFPGASDRDVDSSIVGLSLTKKYDRLSIVGNTFYSVDIPRGDALDQNGKNSISAGLSSQYIVNDTNLFWTSLKGQLVEYGAKHVVFDEVRKDDVLSLSLGWKWAYNKNLIFNPQVTYTNNHSSLSLYKYNRTQFNFGARYQF